MDRAMLESYRNEFPVAGKFIYLDHAGVSPMPQRVTAAISSFLAESSEGGAFYYPKWSERIAHVRRACARLIYAGPDEIAFVKSTSHGLSIVAEGLDWKPGDNVLIYEREFPANRYPWLNLRRKGVEIKVIPSRDNRISLDDVERLLDAKTRLFAVSSVQFTNGFRIDLKRAGELCRRKGVLLCVDAIQSLGVLPMDVVDYGIDFLSADAHKWLLGPEGIGLFYCRREHIERLAPLLFGWKCVKDEFSFDQPDFCLKTDAQRFEEGSLNLLGVFGLGAALDLLLEVGIDRIADRVLGLGDMLIRESELRGYVVVTPRARSERGGNITITGDFEPARTVNALRERGIMVNARGGGIRVSPHFYNTEAELSAFFELLGQLH